MTEERLKRIKESIDNLEELGVPVTALRAWLDVETDKEAIKIMRSHGLTQEKAEKALEGIKAGLKARGSELKKELGR